MATRRSNIELEKEQEERRRKRLQRQREEKRRRQKRKVMIMRILLLCIFAGIILSIVFGVRGCNQRNAAEKARQEKYDSLMSSLSDISEDPLECARILAGQYDYATALEVLTSVKDYKSDDAIAAAVEEYETAQAGLVSYDVDKVPQLTFHTLIVDENQAAAMAGDPTVAAANQNTMGLAAFTQRLQQLYDEGYVLVSMSDLASMEENADGKNVMKKGEILLPEGKTPFVLSQTDVTYPTVLAGAGYGSRMTLGEDGTPTVEYILGDGSISAGDHDVVPIVDTFIEEHPDFSYKGARGVIALKGADGFLGYRTDEEKTAAKPLIEALKAEGWELASNGYGDVSYGSTFDQFQADVDAWENSTGTWLGDVNILLYPYGTDIASWSDYTGDNQKYTYLKEKGFLYFSNEDQQNEYMVQIRDNYVRQARKSAFS